MARARLIRPEFFVDEDLVGVSVEARLLFIGLWTLADREGRLEDRPSRIKMQLFPCDTFNVEQLLDALEGISAINRYVSDAHQIIQIRNFKKYQKVHPHEAASVLPAMPLHPTTSNGSPLKGGKCSPTSTSTSKENIPSSKPDDDAFLRFWSAYPKKVGKGAARKAWSKAVASADASEIIEKLEGFHFPEDKRFIPHPATWINQERWSDEQIPFDGEDEDPYLDVVFG